MNSKRHQTDDLVGQLQVYGCAIRRLFTFAFNNEKACSAVIVIKERSRHSTSSLRLLGFMAEMIQGPSYMRRMHRYVASHSSPDSQINFELLLSYTDRRFHVVQV